MNWSWREPLFAILFIVLFVAAVYVFVELLFRWRIARKLDVLLQTWENSWLQQQQVLREQVNALAEQVLQLQAKASKPVTEEQTPKMSYRQAIVLAQQGFDAQSIAASADISRGEAELIAALYRGQSDKN